MMASSAETLATAEKKRALLVLRRERPEATMVELAAEFGLSKSRVHQLLTQAIAELPVPLAEEVRKLELEKLDRDEAILERKIVKGDTRAIRVRLRIAERRARLLGLDAPRKIQQAVVTATITATDWDFSKFTPDEMWQLRQLAMKGGVTLPPTMPQLPPRPAEEPPITEPRTLEEQSQADEDLRHEPSDFSTTNEPEIQEETPMGGWLLVCDDCAKDEEVKTIGMTRSPPYACDGCGIALATSPNGLVDGNPMRPEQVERIRARAVDRPT